MQYDNLTNILGVDVLRVVLQFLDPISFTLATFTCKSWYQVAKKISDLKPHVNLVIIGYHGAGKSTLCGHLLSKCGRVSPSTMEKIKNEAQNIIRYDLVMAKRMENKETATTLLASRNLETQKNRITIIDTPGLHSYFKKTLAGMFMADAALVLVTESDDAIRTVREYILISFVCGIKHIIFAINKMDNDQPKWNNKDSYAAIMLNLATHAKKIGFRTDQYTFLPLSGYHGDNMMESSPNFEWFVGPSLLQALSNLVEPVRHSKKPLRVPITGHYSKMSVLEGRVETGILKLNTKIIIQPGNVAAEVKSLRKNEREVLDGRPGDRVTFTLDVPLPKFGSGLVLGDPANTPPREIESFVAVIFVIYNPINFKAGFTPLLVSRTFRCCCKIEEVIGKVDKRTLKTIEDTPKAIKPGETGIFRFTPLKPICADVWTQIPSLAKVLVKELRKVVAVGYIKSVGFKGGGGM